MSPTSQVLQNPLFLGQTGQRTLFMVEPPHNGVNIQRYSAYSGEDEVRRAQGLRLRHLRAKANTTLAAGQLGARQPQYTRAHRDC